MSNLDKKYTIFELNFSTLSTLFTVLFVGLKLGHVIDWSWIWVLSPVWGPFVIIGFVLLVIKLITWAITKNLERKFKKGL